MLRAARAASILALTLLALPGCMRVVTAPAPVVRAAPQAVLSQLALVVPIVDGGAPYVAMPWHYARLTIGRHDGEMAEVTHIFRSTRAGLKADAGFPTLPPGDGYWIRVELVQTLGTGLERVVGRGWAGDEDDAGLALVAGGNLARLNVLPTMAGTQIALAPVIPPRIADDDDWRPSRASDVHEVPTMAAPLRAPADDGPTAPTFDMDDRKRARHDLGLDARALDDAAPAEDAGLDDDGFEYPAFTGPAFEAPAAAEPADDGEEDHDDGYDDDYDEPAYDAPDADDDADLPTGDVIDSFSAFRTWGRNP